MVKVELSLYANKLKNVAGAFKGTSDPFAVVTKIASRHGEQPVVLGKTEVAKNNLDPHWTRVFVFDYELGTPTKVAVTLFDEVRKGDNKSMGAAVFDLGELLGARGGTKAKKLRGGGILHAQIRKSEGSGVLRLQMKGQKLKNTEGFLRKSDPFFMLYRRLDAAGSLTWDSVFKSNVVMDNLSPVWEEAAIELSLLCGGDPDAPVLVKVFDHESSGKHELMGQFETTVNSLVEIAESQSKIEMTKQGKPTGPIYVTKAEISGLEGVEAPSDAPSAEVARAGQPNFVDYISGGCELNVVVAVDFTGSNGDPRKPGTLHHLGDSSLNAYEKAIKSILSVLAKYDTDKKFPVLGFGAKYDGVVRHCFQCGPSEEAVGVDGVLDAYRAVFKSGLIMSSPTDITEVIQTAAARAQSALDAAQEDGQQTYTVLLVVTDGAVSDTAATAEVLKQVHDSPLSIVIVGVGNDDFSAMRFLDDLRAPGKRDIVQFVPFNDYCRDPVDLSSATLAEIPQQMVGYFQSKGIQPSAMVEVEEGDIVVEEEEEIDLSLDFGEEEIVVSGGGVGAYRGW
eukprot:Nitzschia sp. Nitz4//scaffold178_size73299//8161//9852//NITZ4_005691-RA/size73299-processed-gene-0.17-mRNA-1//1//CDS//3329539098//6113//frame0